MSNFQWLRRCDCGELNSRQVAEEEVICKCGNVWIVDEPKQVRVSEGK